MPSLKDVANAVKNHHLNAELTYFLSFIISTLIIIILPGPTYYLAFLTSFIFVSLIFHNSLLIALFHTYLLVFFFEQPILILKGVGIQETFNYLSPKILQIPTEIPIRFIIFILFTASYLTANLFKRKLKIRNVESKVLISLSIIVITLLFINQILAGYRASFTWSYFRLTQIFLTFPIVCIFLFRQISEKKKGVRVKAMITAFLLSSIVIQATLSVSQFILQSRLNLRIEHHTRVDKYPYTLEDNLYKAKGTFEFSNYLGTNMSMLLPFPMLYLLATLKRKNGNKMSNSLMIFLMIEIGLGTLALLVSQARWALTSFLLVILSVGWIVKDELISTMRKIDESKKRKVTLAYLLLVIVLVSTLIIRAQKVFTLESRINIVKQSLELTKRYPIFGVGTGSSGIRVAETYRNYEQYTHSLKGAHVTLLHIATDNGIFVAGIFLLFFIFLLSFIYRLRKKWIKNYYLISMVLGVLIFLLCSLAYPLYIFDTSLELFFMYASILIAFTLTQKRHNVVQ